MPQIADIIGFPTDMIIEWFQVPDAHREITLVIREWMVSLIEGNGPNPMDGSLRPPSAAEKGHGGSRVPSLPS